MLTDRETCHTVFVECSRTPNTQVWRPVSFDGMFSSRLAWMLEVKAYSMDLSKRVLAPAKAQDHRKMGRIAYGNRGIEQAETLSWPLGLSGQGQMGPVGLHPYLDLPIDISVYVGY